MILFVNPRATRPKNRRFPLSLMAVGAALPAHIGWEIVDGIFPISMYSPRSPRWSSGRP